ncbi:MAG: hypothetical protein AAGL89_01130 [Pseudomonadota bacterium]
MTDIREAALPQHALLQRYAQQDRCYTDAFTCALTQNVDLWDYIEAFYTTPLFRAEKAILRVGLIGKSTQWDASRLRDGISTFAAWIVEDVSERELLMCDVGGATRSWFAVAQEPAGTRLFFGSAIVPGNEADRPPLLARLLIGPHRMYSRALLRAAARRLAA